MESGLFVCLSLVPRTCKKAEATVYSYADIGIAQHESVHAYCGQTFGQTGPTWYAEGMAEMGQYWDKESRAVNVPDVVPEYFHGRRRFPPYQHKNAITIVNEEQITGDSWENYTQRWALCHMLNHNENYTQRFRDLLNVGGWIHLRGKTLYVQLKPLPQPRYQEAAEAFVEKLQRLSPQTFGIGPYRIHFSFKK